MSRLKLELFLLSFIFFSFHFTATSNTADEIAMMTNICVIINEISTPLDVDGFCGVGGGAFIETIRSYKRKMMTSVMIKTLVVKRKNFFPSSILHSPLTVISTVDVFMMMVDVI